MAKNIKPLSSLEQDYKKQVRRIKSAISREKKKGTSIFLKDFVNPSLNPITYKELARLQSITPAIMRKLSPYFNAMREPVYSDESDESYNLIDEIEEAKKNVSELANLLNSVDSSNPLYATYYQMWEQGRNRLDELEMLSLESPNAENIKLKAVDIAMDNLVQEISEIGELNAPITAYLRDTLDKEIEAYGQEATIGNILGLDPDFVETTRAVMKYGSQDRQARQIVRLVNAITGTSMSAEEIRELSDIIEKSTPFE